MKFVSFGACLMLQLQAVFSETADELYDLSSYPQSDFIWMGTYGGDVEVSPKEELKSSKFGSIEWKLADGAEVKKEQLVAHTAVEELQSSARQLELEESSLELKLKEAKWAHHEKGVALRRKVEDLESQLARMTLSENEEKVLGEKLVSRVGEQRDKIREELSVAQEKLKPELRAEALRVELASVREDLKKATWAHRQLAQTLSVFAPNDGVLKQLKSGEVRAGDVIGTVERRGRAVVTMKLVDPVIRSEAPESLGIMVTDSRGIVYEGDFSKIEKVEGIGFAPQIYEFALRSNDGEALPSDLTGDRMVTVYKKLNQQARIVPKAQFLFEHPDKIRTIGWARFFKSIWPNATVVHVGPSTIAIAEPK